MKKIRTIQLVTALMFMMVFSQCYYDDVLNEPVEPVTDKVVSFQADIIPIFDAGCNGSGCHNTGGTAPDLTPARAYNALKSGNYIDTNTPANSELYQWMAGLRNTPMPLTGPNASNNALVLGWIQQGADNN